MWVMPSETKIRNSTSLSETTSIPVTLIWGPPDPRVACGHEAFRVIEPEWKKGEAEKKQTNKQKQVNTGMSTSPVLLWGTDCLKLFTIDEKKEQRIVTAMPKHTQLPEQQNPTKRFFSSFLFCFCFFICRMISRRDGKKYTKMIHNIVRLSAHLSETWHFPFLPSLPRQH